MGHMSCCLHETQSFVCDANLYMVQGYFKSGEDKGLPAGHESLQCLSSKVPRWIGDAHWEDKVCHTDSDQSPSCHQHTTIMTEHADDGLLCSLRLHTEHLSADDIYLIVVVTSCLHYFPQRACRYLTARLPKHSNHFACNTTQCTDTVINNISMVACCTGCKQRPL